MLNKNILKELVRGFSISEVEKHLVYSFLDKNKLHFSHSQILTSYLLGFNENAKIRLIINTLEVKDLKELEHYLELLIPPKDRKLNGAFFTPNFIVDFIIQQIQPKYEDKCLDPSCGCGAFLIGLVDYYNSTFGKPVKEVVQQNIFGSDILDYNIQRSKILLSIIALENGEYLEECDFNLFHQDSLKANWETKFEVIVGNPPYVKYQDLSDEYRLFLLKKWKTIQNGTFNLYFAFFELGFNLLNEGGNLGYITPNNYFTSLAGKNLRAFFTQNECVFRIADFSHKRVFDAQTYTAITFLNKERNNAITYDRIERQSPETFLQNVNGSPNFLKNLKIKKWRLLKTDEQENIKIIETIGTPLKQLFEICVGIATLKDEVFFVDGQPFDDGAYLKKTTGKSSFNIEFEITKPVYKISDFKNQDDIKFNKRRIIFPYCLSNGTASPVPEKEFKELYPACYQYLLSEKEKLQKRDKGKVKFEPFYSWGRTQGLTKKGIKILTPTFSRYPRFLLVEEEDAFFTNGYGIYFQESSDALNLFSNFSNPLSSVENIDVVQKILNSFVMHYYVSKTSVSIAGGYPCYQKNFIEKFTIPQLEQSEIQTIRSLQEKEKIDEFLIGKYNLNLKPSKTSKLQKQ